MARRTKRRRRKGDQCIAVLSFVPQNKLLGNIDILLDTIHSVPVVIYKQPVIIIL